ncbi:lysozyme inhibitor LprI family protein [Jannaschia sp. M317]|uniref:lysozyme inhibitor LprI family protein n=1 Tax=Jannaschia sp. M317 TaxID=2867011 RepID=UPI0021A2E46D|nr:DUF1311 domain-containing protein [Jannaschia sp. M317]UWQ16945.1 DUF1311 domain-containing protein [Jannaschia sp. M317]
MNRLAIALIGMTGVSGVASAQQVDCQAPDLSGVEMRFCAGLAYEEADAELNAAYRIAITNAKAFDETMAAEGRDVPVTLEETLREAQRAWIPYRDAACDAEALTWRGGTGAPMAGTLCLLRMTLVRTDELTIFGDIE